MNKEATVQSAFCTYIQLQYPNLRYCASLGGIRTSMKQAILAKKTGYVKGFPDMQILKTNSHYSGLFIEIKADKKININAFEDLIEICSKKKEIKLKYELEKNVNLVKFEKNRIEISFNESLDKDFVKDLSSKLFEWTGERWIITFSKLKGQMSVKDKEKNEKKQLIDEMKNSEIFKSVLDRFPDAELIDVNSKKDGVDND